MHVLALALTAVTLVTARPHAPSPRQLAGMAGSERSRDLQTLVDHAVATVRSAFALPDSDTSAVAVTLVDLGGSKPRWASHRGSVAIYPASVVKLFYLAAAHRWMEDGRLEDTEELRRAMTDMIVESSNDATHYVLDVLTGTTSGPELPPGELAEWAGRRDSVNRYYESIGYPGINVNKKPWGDGPYGRETQAMRAFTPSRNALTTDATARLLVEIALGRCVTPERSTRMLELLHRDPFTPSKDPDDQNTGFTGLAAVEGMKLWSKAGWTSRVRHDAALVELPNGARFVLVTFTEGHADERGIVAGVAREVIGAMSRRPAPRVSDTAKPARSNPR